MGQTFGSGRLRIDGERALAFAAEFDPQPFHLDEAAARRSIFGELTASGWHTTAVTMRLLIEGELQPAGGFVGVGLDECHWPRPVRPGDELRVECEVLEVRPSKSRPKQGLIKIRTTTLNQDDEAVLVHVLNLVVLRPEGQSAGAMTLDYYKEKRRSRRNCRGRHRACFANVRISARPFLMGFCPHNTEQQPLKQAQRFLRVPLPAKHRVDACG